MADTQNRFLMIKGRFAVLRIIGGYARPGHGRGPRGRFMGPVEKPKNLGKTLIRIIGYLRQDVLPLLLVIIAILVNTACTLAGPLVIGDTIDRYIIPGDFNGLIWASVMLLAIYGISSLSAFVQGFTMASVSEKTVARMRTDLFAKYQVLSLKFLITILTGIDEPPLQ